MTEKKHNPNPFIRLAQEAKEQKQAATGILDKTDKLSHTGATPKITPRATKIMRKAGRGR
jgi:hypothetical protein